MIDLSKLKSFFLGLAALGILASAVGFFVDRQMFFQSYLFIFIFWVSLSLGSLALMMLHGLTGGEWGEVARPVFYSGARTIAVMAVFVLPIFFGLHQLYHWADAEAVAHDAILQAKSPYLNVGFFIFRSVLFFAIWIALAWTISRWHRKVVLMTKAQMAYKKKLALFSGPGLILYGLTVTFAITDWAMSLDAHWFSTIYGMWAIVTQGLVTFAFTIIVLHFLSKTKKLEKHFDPDHFHDLGNLFFAFTFLWGYMSFSQYIIIWSGNLLEEIPWILARQAGVYSTLALFLVIFHFAAPFMLLLIRDIKRNSRLLCKVAFAVFFFRLADFSWILKPSFARPYLFHWLDAALFLGIGGVWMTMFLKVLGDQIDLFPEPTAHVHVTDNELISRKALAHQEGYLPGEED